MFASSWLDAVVESDGAVASVRRCSVWAVAD